MNNELIRGRKVRAGCGEATIYPEFDFETFSTAGYEFDEMSNKWRSLSASPPHGLGAVGAAAYAEHPSTELLSMAYDLKDGVGPRLWIPELPPPVELFEFLATGAPIEAWNSAFEFHIWRGVCVERMGWPALDFRQLRDSMAKARAWGMPGGLGQVAEILEADVQKDKDGKRLLTLFSMKRNPTKNDARRRIKPSEAPADAAKLYSYNVDDVRAEAAVSAKIPDLVPHEFEMWMLDQQINFRGIYIDVETLQSLQRMIDLATDKYTAELSHITGGLVTSASKLVPMRKFIAAAGVEIPGLTKDDIPEILKRDDLPPAVRRVLEIRSVLGSASVKKCAAIQRRLTRDRRLKDLFAYCGADRTGRFAGRGPQPQNFPSSGPKVVLCPCGQHYAAGLRKCPKCNFPRESGHGPGDYWPGARSVDWGDAAAEDARKAIKTGSLEYVEAVFGDPIAAVSGCLRGLFSSAPGHSLICSDYSAIEAVVLACLAGEQWRIDVFNDHGKIYEMSASKITGIPFEEMMRHKRETGEHHPSRKKIGKVAELASGYQGGVGAWKAFGADAFMSEAEINEAKNAWRRESPMIVKLWRGLEDAAHAAVKSPGACFKYRDITYGVHDDVLYCLLPSGRKLAYHKPRLHTETTPWGKEVFKLTFMGKDAKTKKWVRMDTYGGKLTENTCQAVARDVMTHAMPHLERAGYPIVLHVHDEIAAEVPDGFGSVEEFERIMATMPHWAADWPIRAAGGWRGKNYRKD